MPYVIDAASKINEFQLKAVTEGQNAVVEMVRNATEYIDRTPKAPKPVQKLVEPIESVVGSPAEWVRSIAQSNKEWTQAWLDFHTRIFEVLTPVADSAAGEPTPLKKSGSARGANA
jgi:hypothetical protein